MKRIGDVITPLLQGLGLEEGVRFERLKKEWSTVFREPLSLHIAPSALKKGELLIVVDSPVWLQQVSLLKADVLKKVSSFGVKEVRFRIGRIGQASGKKKDPEEIGRRGGSPLSRDARREIDETVAGLNDADLRENIRQAMERSFRSTAGSGYRKKDR